MGTYDNNYYNSTLLPEPTFTPTIGVIGKSTGDMTKQAFVYGTDGTSDMPKEGGLNYGIKTWLDTNTSYHTHSYVYQPANYPKLNE